MKIKKLMTMAVLVIVLTFSGIIMVGCGPVSFSGNIPNEPSQLHGRWDLTETHYTPGMFTRSRPGSADWTGGYFIEFNSNGSFFEKNFWNWTNTVSGNWFLSGGSLTLNRTQGSDGELVFVSSRTVQISEDGNTLRITYTRSQDGSTWNYTDTYERA